MTRKPKRLDAASKRVRATLHKIENGGQCNVESFLRLSLMMGATLASFVTVGPNVKQVASGDIKRQTKIPQPQT